MSLRKTAITEKEVSDRSNEEKYQEEFLGERGRGQRDQEESTGCMPDGSRVSETAFERIYPCHQAG